MNYRKKMIEVALPLEAINVASAREKSIRHGHPSTLHLWWARRPLAACRAVLFASLVDDPDSDPQFRKPDGTPDEEAAGMKRAELFTLIEDLVRWENSNNPTVINAARAEIARCVASRKIELGTLAKDVIVFGANKGEKHPRGPVSGEGITAWEVVLRKAQPEVVNAFIAERAPPMLDPFCGGGSIPLEAQRLGLRVHASDLNPVPVLINKALVEIPPKHAGRPPVNPESRGNGFPTQAKGRKQKTLVKNEWHGAAGLAADVRYYGHWMRDEAEKRIGHLYPKVDVTLDLARDRPDLLPYVGQQLTVIAWLWARTVASPNPAAKGVHVPLVKSFWLSSKAAKKVWIEPIVDRSTMHYDFTIRTGDGEAPAGTISKKGGDRCLLTGTLISRDYIRNEGVAGRLGVRLMAVVAAGKRCRVYLSPTEAHQRLALKIEIPEDAPEEDIVGDTRYLTPTVYGMTKHRHLYSSRQLVAMTTFSTLVREARERALHDSGDDGTYADAIATYLAFCVSKLADLGCALVTWRADRESSYHTFGRHALPVVWDYAELNPLLDGTGSLIGAAAWTSECIEQQAVLKTTAGTVRQGNANDSQVWLSSALISTDPPYYDNVPYADLSDFFFIWLRRALSGIYPDLLRTVLVPKSEELVADPFRHGGQEAARLFFERGIGGVFRRMRKSCDSEFPTTIYYAFKQTEEDDDDMVVGDGSTSARSSTGWETFLQGATDAGWQIDGTWPIRTELGNRMRGMASNALASSIVLVCRPRPDSASLATRKEFITALHRELPEALRNLQRGNIAPVDLAQAAIGPGMAVFSRYSKVMESDGTAMSVRTALGLINQSLDEVLAEQEGDFDGDTRWALAWFEQFGMAEGPFGVAETLSKAKNTAVDGLRGAGIVVSGAGKVRLVRRDELPDGWKPAADRRLTIWETTQHLIHALDKQGESGAAALMHQLGGIAETARDLAYRLYTLCERKKWAEEALAYNGLVIAWPELTKLAQGERGRVREKQRELM